MKCEQVTFLQGAGADSMPISSSGTPPFLPSNGTPTPAPSSEAGPPMDGSPACGCMKGMLGCSTHPSTPAEWIASMRASLARILAPPVEARESTANAPGFIGRCYESPVSYDPATSSWKTPQTSFLGGSEPSLGTWPSSGMMQNGLSWPLARLVPRINGIAGGASVPTPTTQDNAQVKGQYANPKSGTTLGGYARMWGTPRASDGMQHPMRDPEKIGNPRGRLEDQVAIWTTPCADDTGHRKAKYAQGGSPLSFQAGGRLNPEWVAWLMGWPLPATKLNASEMAKYLSARRRPGKSSAVPLEAAPPPVSRPGEPPIPSPSPPTPLKGMTP